MATTNRFLGTKNTDNTGRKILVDTQTLTTGATIACTTKENATKTFFICALATATPSVTIGVGTSTTAPYVGDEVRFILSADATTRVVTFSTGFTSAGTLSVTASKKATISFVFNGTDWQEIGRAVTA